MKKKKKNDRIRNTSYACGLTVLAAQHKCFKKNYNDCIRMMSCEWGPMRSYSRKNTGYKRRQVFDVICIEIAYTTTVVMLQKFKRMSSPYYVSNIIQLKDWTAPPTTWTVYQTSHTVGFVV